MTGRNNGTGRVIIIRTTGPGHMHHIEDAICDLCLKPIQGPQQVSLQYDSRDTFGHNIEVLSVYCPTCWRDTFMSVNGALDFFGRSP